jgi:hypothetical protein
MKINKLKLLGNLLMVAFLFVALTPIFGAPFTGVVSGLTFASGFIPNKVSLGSVFEGLAMEVWEQDIQEILWPKNDFKKYAINNSQFVEKGKTVHRPQAGSTPNVVINRKEYPAKITLRKDTDETYDLDDYTTDPVLVTSTEEQWLSYDKRSSLLGVQNEVLMNKTAQGLLFNWSPSKANNIVRTSGAADASGFNLATGATGTRKKAARQDIFNLAKVLDDMLVPDDGRYLLLPNAMYYEIFGDDNLALALAMAGKDIFSGGVINELAGFQIMKRSNIGRYSNAGTPVLKAIDAANAVTDNQYALAWHKNFVDVAEGSIKARIDVQGATTFGDVISAQMYFGGQKMRQTTEVGIAALVQSAG